MKAEIVYEDDDFLVFDDINPKADLHLLLTPKEHIESVDYLEDRHKDLMGKMFILASRLAKEQKFAQQGYKLLFNVGRGAGQAVDHLHMHILSGKNKELP